MHDKVYVVSGSTGEYADRVEWIYAVFLDKELANKTALDLEDTIRSLAAELDIDKHVYTAEYYPLIEKLIREMQGIDPGFKYLDIMGVSYDLVETRLIK